MSFQVQLYCMLLNLTAVIKLMHWKPQGGCSIQQEVLVKESLFNSMQFMHKLITILLGVFSNLPRSNESKLFKVLLYGGEVQRFTPRTYFHLPTESINSCCRISCQCRGCGPAQLREKLSVE